jgi:hypothetical protein
MICRLYVALLLSCAGSQTTTHGAAMPLQRAVTAGTSRMPGNSTLIPTVRSSYMQHFARSCTRASGVNAHPLGEAGLSLFRCGPGICASHRRSKAASAGHPRARACSNAPGSSFATRLERGARAGTASEHACISPVCCVHSGCASPPSTVEACTSRPRMRMVERQHCDTAIGDPKPCLCVCSPTTRARRRSPTPTPSTASPMASSTTPAIAG